ncbi:hypothetical protein SAMN05421854_103310 [Amycolatopsis rubida]|uniref:Uncharacterized protein n=1 Tax=Amycolatopsis rubida TaxID=112413 RepID=A0A1I5KT87_9PSEU|nr:hypothetical protein SAMN05421854_103310 [Amycolatopsis rubida]
MQGIRKDESRGRAAGRHLYEKVAAEPATARLPPACSRLNAVSKPVPSRIARCRNSHVRSGSPSTAGRESPQCSRRSGRVGRSHAVRSTSAWLATAHSAMPPPVTAAQLSRDGAQTRIEPARVPEPNSARADVTPTSEVARRRSPWGRAARRKRRRRHVRPVARHVSTGHRNTVLQQHARPNHPPSRGAIGQPGPRGPSAATTRVHGGEAQRLRAARGLDANDVGSTFANPIGLPRDMGNPALWTRLGQRPRSSRRLGLDKGTGTFARGRDTGCLTFERDELGCKIRCRTAL